MTNNNVRIAMPTVDATDVRKSYKLIDYTELQYKKPGNADTLQSREYYGDDAEIAGMKTSILEKGVLESPIVMENDDGNGYRVLEGNRRCYVIGLLLADGHSATATGRALSKVRCEVRPSVLSITEDKLQEWAALQGDVSEEEMETVREHIRKEIIKELGSDALVRNTQRLNWSPVEQARKIKELMDAGSKVEDLSKQFGLTTQTIQVRLNLLNKEAEMPEVIEAIDKQEITFSVGKLLSNVVDPAARKELLEEAKEGKAHDEVKEKIDTKHREAVAAGGKGIKAQDRKREKKTPAEAVKTTQRQASELKVVLASISSARSQYQLVQDEDDGALNSALDLGIAIKVIQWCLDPSDPTPLLNVVLGKEDQNPPGSGS